MNQASRTQSGIRNEDLFYPHEFLVFVEDDADAFFWAQFVPSQVDGLQRHFKSVGGKMELENRIKEFAKDAQLSIVAMDSDYDDTLGLHVDRSRVVCTRFYSIENIMACGCRIANLLGGLTLSTQNPRDVIDVWFREYDQSLFRLFAVDVALRRRGTEFPGMAVKAHQFADPHAKGKISPERVSKYTAESGLADSEIETVEMLIKDRLPRHYFRGHFLMELVGAFIRDQAKHARKRPVNLSNDAMFAGLADCSRICAECAPLVARIRAETMRAIDGIATK